MSIEIYEKLKKKREMVTSYFRGRKSSTRFNLLNLDKMQWMEKFCVRSTKPSQNNKS